MPDGLTTPRKLNQITWDNGITDGDIRPGFFSELLNVEMDIPGKLRCRDGLVGQTIHVPTEDPSKFIHINGDPSSNRENGWNLFITSSTAYIYPSGYDITEDDAAIISLPYLVDIDSIDSIIIGTTIVIASNDNTGEPNPIISIVWNKDSGKFSPPSYIEESDGIYGQFSNEGGWGVHSFNRKPNLSMFSFSPYSKVSCRNAFTSANGFLDNDPENSVAIMATYQRKNTISNASMGFRGRASIQFIAIFVYSDGSLSPPSDPIKYTNNTGDVDATFDVGITICVSKNIFKSVIGVKLYRKIIYGSEVTSGNHDFLMYAPFFDENIHKDLYTIPILENGNRDMIASPALLTYKPLSPLEGADDYSYLEAEDYNGWVLKQDQYGWGQEHNIMLNRISYQHKFTTDDNMYETAGWIKAISSSQMMMYLPSHFYQKGSVSVAAGNIRSSSTTQFKMVINHGESVRVTDRYNIDNSDNYDDENNTFEFTNAMIIGSHLSPPAKCSWFEPLFNNMSSKFPNTSSVGTLDPTMFDYEVLLYRGYIKLGEALSLETIFGQGYTHSAYTQVLGSTPVQNEGYETSFPVLRDNAYPSSVPSFEDEYGEIEVSALSSIKPRHIGAAGGRLFALNVVEDGINNTSKLMYTEFGNLSLFRKDNYIDYGIRDDGHGIAISALKSYIIAHHSASTYVFDISGGSDFAWREVGAFKDIGCIGSKLVANTPYGIFWCDSSHIWYYSGGQPEPITLEIQGTYRSLIPNIIALLYREDLRQLWLVSKIDDLSQIEPDVYVYDIAYNRWHTHRLTEDYTDRSKVCSLFNINNYVHVNVVNFDNTSHAFYLLSDLSTVPFNWSVDTGEMSMQIPEVVKKIRRLYIHGVRSDGYKDSDKYMRVEASGDSSGSVVIPSNIVNDKQSRVSTSIRGYLVRFKLSVESSSFWRGTIDSLGVSYKQKNLK